MRYYGLQNFDQVATYNKLKSQTPGMKGEWCVWNDHLLQEARALGFQADYLPPFNYMNAADMMSGIKHYIYAGAPLIASQRAALNNNLGHSRLIVGFEDASPDGKEARVIVHDPGTRGVPQGGSYRKWPASTFATFWKPKGLVRTGGTAMWIRK